MILGIDEVGRGPWAGPLVVGAVVLGDTVPNGLTDSKKLSKARRNELDDQVRKSAAGYGLGWVYADEIDRIGLANALKSATIAAVREISCPYHEIIIDGTVNFLSGTSKSQYVTTLKKADLLISSVSAASIIAKVARDTYMAEQSKLYPQYGFESHVGYGTKKHRDAIKKHGVTPLHRLSFAPLVQYANSPMRPGPGDATTRDIGNMSESVAARFLETKGHTIIARNWKTKYCEIDIISKKDDTLYFTEVKHRKTAKSGDGLDAITPQKLRQMTFASRLYVHRHTITDSNLRLSVIATSGNDPHVVSIVDI